MSSIPVDVDNGTHSTIASSRGSVPATSLHLLFVLAIPLAAGAACFGFVRIGGMNYTGWIGSALLAYAMLLVFTELVATPSPRIAFPVLAWLPWVILACTSLVWREIPSAVGFPEIFYPVIAPVLIAAASSLVVRSREQLARLLRCYFLALPLLIASGVALWMGLVSAPEEWGGDRALAIAAAMVGAAFLAVAPQRPAFGFSGWLLCLALAVLTGSRMAALAMCVPLVVHPRYPLRWRVLILCGLLLAAVAALQLPQVQERFFHSGSGTFEDIFEGDFNSSGRLDAWPAIYERAWERPLLGAGLGSCTEVTKTLWPGMSHPHNDYLRVGFEVGLVGLAIFLVTVFWQMRDLRRRMARAEGPVHQAYLAAWLGFWVFLALACTDNVLVYAVWFMNPLFALIGAAYGATAGEAAGSPAPFASADATAPVDARP